MTNDRNIGISQGRRDYLRRGTVPDHYAPRGFSLIELMVAMVIGLLILASVTGAYLSGRQSYQNNEGMARLQEEARFAVNSLTQEIRQAGKTGCGVNAQMNNQTGIVVTPVINIANGIGIIGYEYTAGGGTAPGSTYAQTSSQPTNSAVSTNWTPQLDTNLVQPGGVIPGTDVIFVSHPNPVSYTLALPATAGATTVQILPVTPSNLMPNVGDVIEITDCQFASLHQIVSVGSGSPVTLTLSGKLPYNFATTAAELFTYQTSVFWIARPTAGAPDPTLYQGALSNGGITGQPLVPGADNMQILYGMDTVSTPTPNGTPEIYVTADQVPVNGGWSRVVTVRIGLLLRTQNASGRSDIFPDYGSYILAGDNATSGTTISEANVGDKVSRRVFNTTIALRNRSM